MAKEKKPTLRYFARFKEDFGYLRAVIRYGTTRKYVLTPMVVTRAQVDRLDTAGHIRKETEEDAMLEGRLREFTAYVWQVVTPLIESGEFPAVPSWQLTNRIFATKKAEDEARRQRTEARAEATFQRKAAEAEARGHKLHSLTIKEFQRLNKELKATLSPEEYAALWKKGGSDENRN